MGYNWGVLGGCMDACLSGSLPVVVQWAVIYDCRNLVIARIHRRIVIVCIIVNVHGI